MTAIYLLGFFSGFVFTYFLHFALISIGLFLIRRDGFCVQCGRKAPAYLASVVDVETGQKVSAVLCAPCRGHAKDIGIEHPPPWS